MSHAASEQVADRLTSLFSSWPSVSHRHLAAFVAVIEEASFRRAAARLSYTQPTISYQMASLEQAIGHKLIDRGSAPESARPTEAGRLFLQYARAVGAATDQLRRQLDLLDADARGDASSVDAADERGFGAVATPFGRGLKAGGCAAR
jgi:DNA-binding transcriptional LysR family regulator